jgi:hypothetical protein
MVGEVRAQQRVLVSVQAATGGERAKLGDDLRHRGQRPGTDVRGAEYIEARKGSWTPVKSPRSIIMR